MNDETEKKRVRDLAALDQAVKRFTEMLPQLIQSYVDGLQEREFSRTEAIHLAGKLQDSILGAIKAKR